MTTSGLTTGLEALTQSAISFFKNLYENPHVYVGGSVTSELSWTPTFHFKINNHLMILVEVSDTPYPLILNLRATDLRQLSLPIAVYSVCPEEAYLANQVDAKRVVRDGFGLLTMDQAGACQRRAPCIPLIQQISEQEFKEQIRQLPQSARIRLAQAYEKYNLSAPSGTSDVCEIFEGFVLRAGLDAAKKKWISPKDAKAGYSARTLAAMQSAPQFVNYRASIGAAQGFISIYRNLNQHFPKDKKQATQKYRDCRHGFLDGIKKMAIFQSSMKAAGLTGKLG